MKPWLEMEWTFAVTVVNASGDHLFNVIPRGPERA